MTSVIRKLVCASVLTMCYTFMHAQVNQPNYEVGISIASFIYSGDLSPSALGSYKTPGFLFGIYGARKLNSQLSLRGDLSFGHLYGDDSKYPTPAYRQERNFKFSTPVKELSVGLEWHPLENRSRLSPYAFGGLGISFLNIKRDYSNFNTEYFAIEPNVITGLSNDAAHSLPRALAVIPLSLGLKYSLNKTLSLTTEYSYRYFSTDYLDGFSEAANPNKKDKYYSFSVGIRYSLGIKNSLNCPTKF